MKRLILLLLMASCSQLSLNVDNNPRTDIHFVSRGKYQEIKGAKNLLRNVSGATLEISFMTDEHSKFAEDLMAFSVGGGEPSTLKSRASLRLGPDGYLVGIARADDHEGPQNVFAQTPVLLKKYQTATLVVNYAENSMKIFLDGKELPVTGNVRFTAPKTSDTPSINSTLGAEDDGSTFFFRGQFRDPKVWTRALSADEISKR